jgi:lipopolysaccharide heptosyltransferase II
MTDAVQPERILIIVPSWVGDVVMATPAIRSVRGAFPDAHLTVLARQTGSDVLEHSPHIDRIITANKRGEGPETSSVGELVRLLRSERFDLAVLLPNSLRAALLAWRARAGRRVGYAAQWRSIFLTDALPQPRENSKIVPINMVDRYLAICRHLGCSDLSQREELFASEQDEANADEILASLGVAKTDRLVVMVPGASFGPSKLWGAAKFAAVGDALIERHGFKVLAQVGPGEGEVGRQVADASDRGVLLAEPGLIDLRTLKAVVRRSALVVANDTGPRHYAVAYDIPNVVILGPTSRRYIDVNMEKTELLQAEVDCGPCQQKVCTQDHRCMLRVTPGQVIAATEALLGRTAALSG